ncbi:MAG: ATP-binding protein [Planctomycetes bacterium]|nr:ATP-binding protein [Planctomycetota bacterium]
MAGRLVVVVGLPGSGKSRWLEERARDLRDAGRPPAVVLPEFLRGARFRRSAPPVSPFLGALREALARGGTCLVGGVAFTREERRREFAASLADLPGLRIEWAFFANDPETCRGNVLFDERFRGRPAAHRWNEIARRAGTYVVPAGFEAMPVVPAGEASVPEAASRP